MFSAICCFTLVWVTFDFKWFCIGWLVSSCVWVSILGRNGLRCVLGRGTWILDLSCCNWYGDQPAPYDWMLEIIRVFDVSNIFVYFLVGLFHYNSLWSNVEVDVLWLCVETFLFVLEIWNFNIDYLNS